jgi:hypothetical protein
MFVTTGPRLRLAIRCVVGAVVRLERRVGPVALRTSLQYARCFLRSAAGLSACVCILHCLLASSKSILIVNLGIYCCLIYLRYPIKCKHILRIFGINYLCQRLSKYVVPCSLLFRFPYIYL